MFDGLFGKPKTDRRRVTIWSRHDSGPMRGTIPPGEDWPYGSRQVIRRGMTRMYTNLFAKYNYPRRLRRAMARSKMHNVYRKTKLAQLESGIVGTLPKQKKASFLVALAKFAADIFKPRE